MGFPKVTPQIATCGQDSHLTLRADHGIIVRIVDVDGHDGWLVLDNGSLLFYSWSYLMVAHPPRDRNQSSNIG
jgi:hypothetical protein